MHAACTEPLGERFAYVEDNPGDVVAGRSLPEVLYELIELPWGKWERWIEEAIAELAAPPDESRCSLSVLLL